MNFRIILKNVLLRVPLLIAKIPTTIIVRSFSQTPTYGERLYNKHIQMNLFIPQQTWGPDFQGEGRIFSGFFPLKKG